MHVNELLMAACARNRHGGRIADATVKRQRLNINSSRIWNTFHVVAAYQHRLWPAIACWPGMWNRCLRDRQLWIRIDQDCFAECRCCIGRIALIGFILALRWTVIRHFHLMRDSFFRIVICYVIEKIPVSFRKSIVWTLNYHAHPTNTADFVVFCTCPLCVAQWSLFLLVKCVYYQILSNIIKYERYMNSTT